MRRHALALLVFAGASALALREAPPTPLRAAQSPGLTPWEIVRAERFLEERAACLGCHVIAGRGGRIGPTLDGLGDRADADYVRAVIQDPDGTIPGTLMPRQPLPDREVELLTRYLLGRPVVAPPQTASAPEAPPALEEAQRLDGAALYARHCAACHGEGGGGDGWNAADLPVPPTAHGDAELMGARTDDSLYDAIFAGAHVLDGSPRMPGFGSMLTPEQIDALVAHVRRLCDCAQPAWAGDGAR